MTSHSMENNTLFFLVSTGGSIVDGPTGLNQTYRYVGGITRELVTQMGDLKNVWVLKEEVKRFNGGDVPIKIFLELGNGEGLRLLRPVQTHADAAALVEIGMAVPFTSIYILSSKEVAHQLDALRRPKSKVVSGDIPSEDSVHNY